MTPEHLPIHNVAPHDERMARIRDVARRLAQADIEAYEVVAFVEAVIVEGMGRVVAEIESDLFAELLTELRKGQN